MEGFIEGGKFCERCINAAFATMANHYRWNDTDKIVTSYYCDHCIAWAQEQAKRYDAVWDRYERLAVPGENPALDDSIFLMLCAIAYEGTSYVKQVA